MAHNAFRERLAKLYRENHFIRSDEFMVEKFSGSWTQGELTEEIRRKAYRSFYQQIGRVEIASVVTMRRWFGIHGYTRPDRMQVYEMALRLGMDREETEEYLTRGLGEASFQISDYHEMIYLYGIENRLTFEKCQQMIGMFERNLTVDQKLSATRNTEQLQREYEQQKELPISDFLLFMTDNLAYFKGYSNTALNYLLLYRNQVLKYIRSDASRQLTRWLAETNYEEWKEKHQILARDPYRAIRKFIRTKRLSEVAEQNIKELARLAYSTLDNNSLVHSELFTGNASLTPKVGQGDIKVMSMKYMSDLLNVATQKENAVRVLAAQTELEGMQSDTECPEDVQALLQQLSRHDECRMNCSEAMAWLQKYDKEHKRRQQTVQRADILPFVLYVSQQKYLHEQDQEKEIYQPGIARDIFRKAADNVLTACNMLPLDGRRELDAVLLACYQEDEMYGYPDLLEAMYG